MHAYVVRYDHIPITLSAIEILSIFDFCVILNFGLDGGTR